MNRSALLILLSLTTACAGTGWQTGETLQLDRLLVVETEQYRDQGKAIDVGYAHPAAVDSTWLASTLQELRHRAPDGEEEAIVPDLTVGRLGGAICRGLAQASGSERVRFLVFLPERNILGLPTFRFTRGVAFVEPVGTLNLAFDLVDDPAEDDENEKPNDPTLRSFTRGELAFPDGVAQYKETAAGPQKLWLTCEVVAAAVTVAEPKPTTEPAAAIPVPPATTKTAAPVDELDARLRFLDELHDQGSLTDADYKAERTEILDRQQRLRFLDELHREGRISDADYRAKRAELLR